MMTRFQSLTLAFISAIVCPICAVHANELHSAEAPVPLHSPEVIASVIERIQNQVQALPANNENSNQIAIAVSLSMPRASLLRLAQDAKDAGLALSFRGVGETIPATETDDGKMPTVIERYGSHLLKRHLASFDFLREVGVTIRIDPMLFQKANINHVPQVLVIGKAHHPLQNCALTNASDSLCAGTPAQTTVITRAIGDVTLAFALRHLEDELKTSLKENQGNEVLMSALQTVQATLKPLGERP